MSGMSSMLHILLYREASSHHQPNEKGGTAARDATIPKSCSPFNHLVARGVVGGIGGMPRMLLISLMRSTPPFWMPASLRMPEPQPDESIVDPPGPKSNFAGPWQTLF